MVKRAVVCGINDYSVQGFNNLSACVRDAQAFYHLLVDAFIFDPTQVWLYTDQTATSRNIRAALSYMLSVSEPGDVACLYFAGHGGLHPLTADTYYQTVIPYSGRFLSDFDLLQAAETLRQSEVNFTVVLDSCHSGGMHEESEHPLTVRGIRFAREMAERIRDMLKKLIPFGVTVPGPEAYQQNVRGLRLEGDSAVLMEEDEGQQFVPLAKSTMLSACRWDEFAGENASHGYFTQGMLDTVNQSNFLADHRTFHRDVLSRTKTLSGDSQTVQLRGQQNRMEEEFLVGWHDSR